MLSSAKSASYSTVVLKFGSGHRSIFTICAHCHGHARSARAHTVLTINKFTCLPHIHIHTHTHTHIFQQVDSGALSRALQRTRQLLSEFIHEEVHRSILIHNRAEGLTVCPAAVLLPSIWFTYSYIQERKRCFASIFPQIFRIIWHILTKKATK